MEKIILIKQHRYETACQTMKHVGCPDSDCSAILQQKQSPT